MEKTLLFKTDHKESSLTFSFHISDGTESANIVLIAVFEKKWKHQSIICIPVTCQLLGVLSPVLTVRLENQCEIQLTWHTFGQACGKVRSWGVTRQRKRKRTHPCHSRAHSSACVFVFNCISHAFRKIISSNR